MATRPESSALKRSKGEPLATIPINLQGGLPKPPKPTQIPSSTTTSLSPPPSSSTAPSNRLPIDLSNLPGVHKFLHMENLEVYDGARRELSALEREYQPDPDYLRRHPELNARMRAILLDWLFEVGQEYALKRETLHTAINYVDRYLSKYSSPSDHSQKGLPKKDLQLLGVTSLWLASKVEEILPPPVNDFAMATDSGCTSDQMKEMETLIVANLSWQLVPPTVHAWANLFLHCLLVNMRSRSGAADPPSALWNQPSIVPHVQINRVMELLDFTVLDADSLCFYPSELAASAIALLINRDSHNTYTLADLEIVTHMSSFDLVHCMAWMAFTLNLPTQSVGSSAARTALGSSVEPHTVQRHHPKALDEYYREIARRGGSKDHPARHEACKQHLARRRARNFSESEVDNSELSFLPAPTTIDLNSERLRVGAMSPVTDLAHRMINTRVMEASKRS